MTEDKTTDSARDPRGENEFPDGFTRPVIRDPMESLTSPPLFADGLGFYAGKHLHEITEYEDQSDDDHEDGFDYEL